MAFFISAINLLTLAIVYIILILVFNNGEYMTDFLIKNERTFINNGVTMVFSTYPEGIGELIAYTKEENDEIVGYTTVADIFGDNSFTQDFGVGEVPHGAVVIYLFQKYTGGWKKDLKGYIKKWISMLPEEQEFYFMGFNEFMGELSHTEKKEGIDRMSFGS